MVNRKVGRIYEHHMLDMVTKEYPLMVDCPKYYEFQRPMIQSLEYCLYNCKECKPRFRNGEHVSKKLRDKLDNLQ